MRLERLESVAGPEDNAGCTRNTVFLLMAASVLSDDRLSSNQLEALQVERLRDLCRQIVPKNPFWTACFASAGLRPDEIRSLEDLRRLPFVTKADLAADQMSFPPFGSNLTRPIEAYSRLHQTSGTTSSPLRWLDTPANWEWMLRCWEQLFHLMQLNRDDRLFFAFSFGPFLGFWAGFEGANQLGNLCVPGGGLSSQARLQLIRDSGATIVCCTPTYALRLAEVADEQGVDLKKGPVRAILVAGEPGGNIPATRRCIETAWGARVVDHWGMTELGPLAVEPADRPGGLTVLETECIAQIVDPETGDSVADGAEGELVITNLGRTDSPLLRYRTGDRVRAAPRDQSHARFGSNFLHLDGGILGRTDEMLTIRGNNFYPAALEDMLRGFGKVVEFRIELRTIRAMPHLKIAIEPAPDVPALEVQALAERIAGAIKDRWNFHVEVAPAAPGALPRFEMKARRFVRVPEP
ncbi:MAG: phenylacetate--CoA ligase family protein [Planctomycetaceae bacterium]